MDHKNVTKAVLLQRKHKQLVDNQIYYYLCEDLSIANFHSPQEQKLLSIFIGGNNEETNINTTFVFF